MSRHARFCCWLSATILLTALLTSGQVVVARGPANVSRPKNDKSGLHIPQGQRINFNHNMNDGGGYPWDIQYYGTVGHGQNYAYSSGMYLHVNGNNFISNGQGWQNEAGDEIELGIWNYAGLQVSRRVKVYKDYPLARWMDIFHNPSDQDITCQVQIYTCTNYGIQSITTNSDGQSIGEEDWAFITQPNSPQPPKLLHVFCSPKAELRPTVQANINNNQIYYRFNLTVPAGKDVVLMYFESQNRDIEAHKKLMEKFPLAKLVADLKPEVRKLVMNMKLSFGIEGISLDRSDNLDSAIFRTGDPVYGKVLNKSFDVETFFGKITLPAEQVVGMASAPDDAETLRFCLADGQIISGRSPGTKLTLKPTTNGAPLQIPLSRLAQWSYRISPKRPEELVRKGAFIFLRTGDQLAFDVNKIQLSFQTKYGPIPLTAKDLQAVRLDGESNAVHRAIFRNGSTLAGFLLPEKIQLPLKLGETPGISRDMVTAMVMAEEPEPNPSLTEVTLCNGDVLFGELVNDGMNLKTEYGEMPFKRQNLRTIAFNQAGGAPTAVQLWDGSVWRGTLQSRRLAVRIVPGPELKIPTSQIVTVVRNQVLPPAETLKKVQELIGRLGAESYKDREDATKALIEMGPSILEILKKYADDKDPEVRQRVQTIIEKLGKKVSAAPPVSSRPGAMFVR